MERQTQLWCSIVTYTILWHSIVSDTLCGGIHYRFKGLGPCVVGGLLFKKTAHHIAESVLQFRENLTFLNKKITFLQIK